MSHRAAPPRPKPLGFTPAQRKAHADALIAAVESKLSIVNTVIDAHIRKVRRMLKNATTDAHGDQDDPHLLNTGGRGDRG